MTEHFWDKEYTSSIQMKEDLLGNPLFAQRIRAAEQLPLCDLRVTVLKILKHPKYKSNKYSHIVLGIVRFNNATPKQRACLEIHYCLEYALVTN